MTGPTTDSQRVAIKARRVRFDWTATPLHWLPGDPQTTHTINVLHLLLPAGEKWFCELYREVLPEVTDDRLRADLRGFIGQEATHSRAHAVVLDHLAALDLPTERYTRFVDWLFGRLLNRRPLGLRLPGFLGREWARHRLAVVAAVEHFTSALGWWVLNAEGLDKAEIDPVMLDLLRWHGAEEVEHRAVAFEVSEHLGGGYLRRIVGLAEVVPALAWMWLRGVLYLMHADPSRPGRIRWRSFRQAGRRGTLPTFRELLRMVPAYLRPSYHPLDYGSTDVARDYLARSPAAIAAA